MPKKCVQEKDDSTVEREHLEIFNHSIESSSDSKVQKRKRNKTSSRTLKQEKEGIQETKKIKINDNSDFDDFDKNITLDLSQKDKFDIKINQTLAIKSDVVRVDKPGKKPYSFPVLIFEKKCSGNKVFGFNIPLYLLPKLQEGLSLLDCLIHDHKLLM